MTTFKGLYIFSDVT